MPSFWSFLRHLFKRTTPSRHGRGAARRFRPRLTVEPLETRTMPNSAPVLGPLGDVVLPRTQAVLQVPVQVFDPDGDPVALGARLVGSSAAAGVYQLDAQYGLTMQGTYFTGFLGYQEKWLQGNDGQYFLLPNGELRRWRDANYSFGPDGLVASLGARFYDHPEYLWQAADSVRFSGNALTIDRPVWYVGAFTVEVTASDGLAATSVLFNVTIPDAAPVIAPLANQVMSPLETSLTVAVQASDADGDPLTYSARASGVNDPLYQYDQQLGLGFMGSYYTNFQGHGEKWLQGRDGQYFLLPNGELRRWSDAVASYGPQGLVATFSRLVYDDPSRLWNARPAVNVTFIDNLVTVSRAADFYGAFSVQVFVSDGFVTSTSSFTVSAPDPKPVWQNVHDWTVPSGQDMITVPLSVSSPLSLVYSAQIVGQSSVPAPMLSLLGNQLTIDPPPGCHGVFTVQAIAANSLASSAASFNVIVPNAAPALGALSNYTMPHQQDALGIALSATDADHDPLTFSAQVLGPAATAYSLDQRLGLSFAGSYWTNFQGHQEKWLQGTDAQYFLLPNGELRRWREAVYSYGPQGLVATLGAAYYADPAKLWNASPPPAVSVVGNQLTVDPPSLFVGSVSVLVTVNDGLASSSGLFTVTVTNNAPVIKPIAKQVILPTQDHLTLTLQGSDRDADALTYSGQVRDTGLASLAYRLDQQLNLGYLGGYFTNFQGHQEKWLQGQDAQYFLLPNGELRRWRNSVYSYGPAGLVATLDRTYYADPSRLWNARQPIAVTVSGNQLTVTRSFDDHGTFTVDATVTDGMTTTSTPISVVLPDGAPHLGSLQDQIMSPGQDRLVLPLDADSFFGPVRYTAQVLDTSAPVSLTIKGNALLIDPSSGFRGTFNVAVTASNTVGTTQSTFRVTVPAAPPIVAGVPTQVLAPHQQSITIPLQASDPGGNPLNYAVQLSGPAVQAFDVDQRLGLSFRNSYFTNFQGHQEKWLQGQDAQYFLLPNGELRRWHDSVYSYGPAGLVATLDRTIYADPTALWDAKPLPTVTVTGNQLTLDPHSDFQGRFAVSLAVSNGPDQTTRRFEVFVNPSVNPVGGAVAITGFTDSAGKTLGWVTNQSALYAVGIGTAGGKFDVLVDGAVAGSGQVGGDGQWKVRLTLTPGDHVIEARSAGASAPGSSLDVSVDVQPPVLSLTSEYTLTQTLKLTLQVDSPDGYPLATQAVVDTDRDNDGTFTDVGEQNVARVNVVPGANVFYLDPRALEIAQVRVRLKDQAGNEGVSTVIQKPTLPPALPVHFDVNQGQFDSQTQFVVHGNGYNGFFTSAGLTLAVGTAADPIWGGQTTVPLHLRFANANPSFTLAGEDRLPSVSNYELGSDASKWKTNVPNYGMVRYSNVYDGVKVDFRDGGGQVQYDIVADAGVDPSKIVLELPEAQALAIDEQGQLLITLAGGQGPQLILTAPRFVQRGHPDDERPTGRYVLKGGQQVGFEIANVDPMQPLMIDPVLFSTYAGGSQEDVIQGLALDGAGNSYITGYTQSTDFPVSSALQGSNAGGQDIFVSKLNAAGTALLYSTYVGGSGDDRGWDLALDAAGNVYVTGDSASGDFPITSGVFQTALSGNSDAVVFKLNSAGGLAYSTYLGGAADDSGRGIAVLGDNALVTGQASGSTFPTTAGSVQSSANFGSTFLTRLSAAGSAALYSTYIGGDLNYNEANAVGLDAAGNAYVAGATDIRLSFPTTPGAFQTDPLGGEEAFLLKVNPTGSNYAYGTLVGGSADDFGNGIAVDAAGSAYVTGETSSINFPTSANAYQPVFVNNANDPVEAFVTKFNLTGSNVAYSTYVGGTGATTGGDHAHDIAIDGTGTAYIVGKTDSTQFPLSGAPQRTKGGGSDAFVAALSPSGGALGFSTYLGGSGDDTARAVAVDAAQHIFVAGDTKSTNFPTSAGGFQTTAAGEGDGFLVKYVRSTLSAPGGPSRLPPQVQSVQVINGSQQRGNEEEVEVAVDPTNPQRVFFSSVQDTRATGLLAGFSTDGGLTWNRRFITDGSDGFPTACCDPSVSWDEFGNLFLTYITSNIPNQTVVLLLSIDGGATFRQAATFGIPGDDQPKVGTGANSVWVYWEDNNGIEASGAPVTGLGAIGSFNAMQTVPNSPVGNFGNLAIGPNGQVLVSFEDSSSGVGPNTIHVSLDPDGLGPQGFGQPVLVVSPNVGAFRPIPAQPQRMIDSDGRLAWDRSGGAHNGRVYLDYVDAPSVASNDTNVFVRFSDDNGQTWSPAVQVNDDTSGNSQFFARMAVDQTTGNLGLAWYDARLDTGSGAGDLDGRANTNPIFFGSLSFDGGQTFVQNYQIAGGPSSAISNPNGGFEYGDYTGGAFFNNKYYATWADNSNSDGTNPDGAGSGFDIYVGIVTVVSSGGPVGGPPTPPPLPSDVFELNEVDDQATNLNALTRAAPLTFNDLTIARHPNNLPDYDWFRLQPAQSGSLTVTVDNIRPRFSNTDIHVRVFQLVNGNQIQLGASTLTGGVTAQAVSVGVAAGADIFVWVYGFNYAEATYNLTLTLS